MKFSWVSQTKLTKGKSNIVSSFFLSADVIVSLKEAIPEEIYFHKLHFYSIVFIRSHFYSYIYLESAKFILHLRADKSHV